jgi:hypothetical protein
MSNRAIIVLACLSISGAAAAQGQAHLMAAPGQPALSSPFGAEAFATDSADGCSEEGSGPCVRSWLDMSAKERAQLWPYLDDVSRAMHWRSMTPAERRSMRAEMSEGERDRLRRRYSVPAKSVKRVDGPLCTDEVRSELRRQVTEFHVELTGRHDHGMPRHAGGPAPAGR